MHIDASSNKCFSFFAALQQTQIRNRKFTVIPGIVSGWLTGWTTWVEVSESTHCSSAVYRVAAKIFRCRVPKNKSLFLSPDQHSSSEMEDFIGLDRTRNFNLVGMHVSCPLCRSTVPIELIGTQSFCIRLGLKVGVGHHFYGIRYAFSFNGISLLECGFAQYSD